MAGLSVAHRAALAQLVDSVSDATLERLAMAVRTMPGEKARQLDAILALQTVNRARRHAVLGPLAPMFQPRADGVEALTFPKAVYARLWGVTALSEPDRLPELDVVLGRTPPEYHRVRERFGLAAAAVVRNHPNEIWPDGDEAGLDELAKCCDLLALAHRAMPHLTLWVGRPDEDQFAALRLAVRDATQIAVDGDRRLLDILSAHLADAALILRLVVHSTTSAQNAGLLARSELSVFVERLVATVEARTAQISGRRPEAIYGGLEAFRVEVAWLAEVVTELETTLPPSTSVDWGKRVQAAKLAVHRKLTALLANVEKIVERVLPMSRVQTAGRMSRAVPDMGGLPEPETEAAAQNAVAMVTALRGAAGVFACEGPRWALVVGLTERISDYADLALEAVNAGDVENEAVAMNSIAMTARLLDGLDAAKAARLIRRRRVVAGGPVAGGLVGA